MAVDVEAINALVTGEGLKEGEEVKLLAKVSEQDPEILVHIVRALTRQRREGAKQLAQAKLKQKKADKLLEKLMSPPLHPADVFRLESDGRIQVVCDGRRLVVAVLPGLDVSELRPGDEVFLDTDTGFLVSLAQSQQRAGAVGSVSEVSEGRVVVSDAVGAEDGREIDDLLGLTGVAQQHDDVVFAHAA